MTSSAPPPPPSPQGGDGPWAHVDRLVDELAALGDDLPAELSVDERRAAILRRLE